MSYLFLFGTGFLVSRLSVRYGLVEFLFARLFKDRADSFSRFLLLLAAASALVSMFIPNLITVLTLLPMLEALRQHFEESHDAKTAHRLTTAMVLVVIYGSNIGGMGSIVGSPANALMLGALEVMKVAGREKINFLSWFGWSLPLAAALVTIAWAQVSFFIVPAKERKLELEIPRLVVTKVDNKEWRLAWHATAAWFVFWTAHSIGQLLSAPATSALTLMEIELRWTIWDLLAVAFGIVYIAFLFAPVLKDHAGDRRSLLRLSDCFSQLPIRGFVFVIIALAISGLFIALGAPVWLAEHLLKIIPDDLPAIALYLFILLITTMSTEVFSNTTVSVVLFPLVYSLATSLGLNPLVAMMAVGLASTNAFMLPIATPVNALAFGGVKNVSLPTMVVSGFLLNLTSSFWMAIFLSFVVPWYYGL